MTGNIQSKQAWLWLTLPLTLLVALASVCGLLRPSLYGTSISWVAQGQAQDFVDLFFVLPPLVISAILAARGSRRGLLIWLGALAYLVYSYVIYAFSVRYNALFLVYVAALGCAAWALIGGMTTAGWAAIAQDFSPHTPAKPISSFLLVLTVLFYLLWLKEDLTALLTGATPQTIVEAGLLTNPVHVLDMALLLPAMALGGVLLWRKQLLGYGLAGVLLVIAILEAVGIAGMFAFSARAGISGTEGLAVVFAVLTLVGTVLLAWYLRGLQSGPVHPTYRLMSRD